MMGVQMRTTAAADLSSLGPRRRRGGMAATLARRGPRLGAANHTVRVCGTCPPAPLSATL